MMMFFFTTRDTKKTQRSQSNSYNCVLCENLCALCGKYLTSFLILLPSLFLSAQEPEINRERTFTGDGLYGFMNGAADLFLEYGFKTLVTSDITYKDEAFTVDIYEMPSPDEAYGIYSMRVFRCQQADSLGGINCFSPYQLQAVVENYYISIVFPSNSVHAQQIASELIPLNIKTEKASLPDIPEETKAAIPSLPNIPEEIAASPPYSGIIKYLAGPISVSNTSPDLTTLLENITYRGVWFKTDSQTKNYQAIILFPSPEEKETLARTIPKSDIIRSNNKTLHIQRQEKESNPPKSGDFGF